MRRGRAGRLGVPVGVALAIALGTGCFSDRGVAIVVDIGDLEVTRVELYLGTAKCDPDNNEANIDCTTIAPPQGKVALPGTIWFRDGLLPETAPVKGHTATFQVTAASPTTLPIVIAVGLLDTPAGTRALGIATLRDLEIPVNSARVVTAALTGANQVVPEQTDTRNLDEDRALVWTKQTPASSCVVVEHWSHGQATRDFVVPAEDPDCDDVAPECNPAAYHGPGAIGGAQLEPDCVVEDAARCVLGIGCSDDTPGEIAACVAAQSQFCVPEPFCPCTSLAGDCIQNTLDSDPLGIPHVECEVPTTPMLGLCNGGNSALIDLSLAYQGRSCGRQPLLASLQATGFAQSRSFGDATFELSGATDQCKFKVTWKQGAPSVADDIERGFIVLETPSGGLLLPIVFRFQTGLGACVMTPFQCALVYANDSLWSCIP